MQAVPVQMAAPNISIVNQNNTIIALKYLKPLQVSSEINNFFLVTLFSQSRVFLSVANLSVANLARLGISVYC